MTKFIFIIALLFSSTDVKINTASCKSCKTELKKCTESCNSMQDNWAWAYCMIGCDSKQNICNKKHCSK